MLTPRELLFELLDRNLVLALKDLEGDTSDRAVKLLEQLRQAEMGVLSYLFLLQERKNESISTSTTECHFECLPPTQPSGVVSDVCEGDDRVHGCKAAS